jgi:hypothetical protein
MNTPEELTFEFSHDYSEISSDYRIKIFDVDYDENAINHLQEQVKESRQYIKQLCK